MASGKDGMRKRDRAKAKAQKDRLKRGPAKRRHLPAAVVGIDPSAIPDEVVADILAKRDLLVHPDLARTVAARYLGKHPELLEKLASPDILRLAVYEPMRKWVRQELRVLVGMFVVETDPSKLLESPKEAILSAHRSTLERQPHYPRLYQALFRGKNPAAILDLCAGLNGCSYEFLGCSPRYTAIDVSPQLMDFTQAWFTRNHVSGVAYAADVTAMTEFPAADTVFLFKATDVLERVKYGFGYELLDKLVVADGRRVIVSFATATISGTREIKLSKRAWVERWAETNSRTCHIHDTIGERYYVIE